MTKPQKFLLSVFLFLIFVGFSYLVQKHFLTQIDFDTTVKIQDKISRDFDTFLSSLSLFGSLEVSAVFLLIILAIKRNLGLLVLIPFSFVTLHLFELFGKLYVRHPGPPFMFFRYDINFLFPSSYVKPGFSYPSGHAARATFITIIILYFVIRSKKLTALNKAIISAVVLLFDIGMLTSRVYLGEHWTSDVIGGSLLGVALSLFTVSFIEDKSVSKQIHKGTH